MATRGRKSGFNDKIRETIIRLIDSGKTEAEVAEVIGVSTRTIQNWKGKHVELMHAIRESKLAADELVEASLYSRALGYSHPEEKVAITKTGDIVPYQVTKHYPPDTQAAMFWLRNRQPDRWKEKTEGDVNVSQNVNVNHMSDEELNAKIARLLESKDEAKENDGK